MQVILDTNVLLAALISPHGAPNTIYRAWMVGRFHVVSSTQQIDELRRASRYPKLKAILPAHRVGTLINTLQQTTVLTALSPLPAGIHTQDPNDAFLLAMALTSKADFLVTGDKRAGLLEHKKIRTTQVLTPQLFCKKLSL
jgi:putative PIN family toxin of toxin-antitoxin system